MANREAGKQTTKEGTRQDITPVMLVVTDTRQADINRQIDSSSLEKMTEKLAAGPCESRLNVKLHFYHTYTYHTTY